MRRPAEAALVGAALCISISVACDAVHTARADAAPPGPAADYTAALRQGRELLRQNKPRDAVVALDSALKARPDDSVALSELGWALLLAGDLARAQKESERAAALSHDPKLRAASLYNLGRAAEAATNRTAALAAYRQSLKLRPSAEVHARLAALDPAVTALEQKTPYSLDKLNRYPTGRLSPHPATPRLTSARAFSCVASAAHRSPAARSPSSSNAHSTIR